MFYINEMEFRHINAIDFLQHISDLSQVLPDACIILKDFDFLINLYKEEASILETLAKLLLYRKGLVIATVSDLSSKISPTWIVECFDIIMKMPVVATIQPAYMRSVQSSHIAAVINSFLQDNYRQAKGILLYGPPGVGKTASIREICKETGVFLKYVSMHHVLRAEIGQSEAQLRGCFENTESKTLLFIDELDAIFTKSSKSERLIMELCSCFENLSPLIIVVAATNLLEEIPKCLRIGTRFAIEIEVSGKEANRNQIVCEQFSKNPFLITDGKIIAKLVQATASFSVADLRLFVNRIKLEYCSGVQCLSFEGFLEDVINEL